MLLIGLLSLASIVLIGWAVYLVTYRHPADYTEATVTVLSASTTATDTPTAPALPSAAANPTSSASSAPSSLAIDGHIFSVDLADTLAKRIQGLSGRERLREDQGMLFLFPYSSRQSFWMKDMKFPLDMVWISSGRIVDISKDVPVPTPGQSVLSLPQFAPSAPVDTVLEIDAGLSTRYGFKIGDTVELHLPANEKIPN
jgi:uncharacterized membrane protein (UPF0127 family)